MTPTPCTRRSAFAYLPAPAGLRRQENPPEETRDEQPPEKSSTTSSVRIHRGKILSDGEPPSPLDAAEANRARSRESGTGRSGGRSHAVTDESGALCQKHGDTAMASVKRKYGACNPQADSKFSIIWVGPHSPSSSAAVLSNVAPQPSRQGHVARGGTLLRILAASNSAEAASWPTPAVFAHTGRVTGGRQSSMCMSRQQPR